MLCHPDGRFIYVANRGPDTIAVIKFDPVEELAVPIAFESTLGQTPRNFQLDPTGRSIYVANQNSSTVEQFLIDAESGRLQHLGRAASVPAPTCILFTSV
jgi:6-phosphogluconolactonase